jgi:Holliday junction resolvase RusA-like endonuclease
MTFTIDREPVPKARPRFYQGHAITPSRTKAYEAAVRRHYLAASGKLHEGAIRIDITFYMPIPKSRSKKDKKLMLEGRIRPQGRPDIDNLEKAVWDALNGYAWTDDARIVESSAKKLYAEHSCSVVTIEEL